MHASLAAPKKIIKALYDYQAQGPHELSFSQGDFFHVVGRENDDQWFEACNPATNSKGIVPVSYFQVLDKSERSLPVQQPAASKADSGFIDEQDITHGNEKEKKMRNLDVGYSSSNDGIRYQEDAAFVWRGAV